MQAGQYSQHQSTKVLNMHCSPKTAPRGLKDDCGMCVEGGLIKLREAHIKPDKALESPFHCKSTLQVTANI